MALGSYLKELRKRKKLSLRETAKRADMSSSYLSQLENGHNSNPNKEILMKLSTVLDVPYVSLLLETDVLERHKDAIKKNLNNDPDKIAEQYEDMKKLKYEHEQRIETVKKLVKQGFTTNENAEYVYILENYLNDEVITSLNGQYLTNAQKREILSYAVYLINKPREDGE